MYSILFSVKKPGVTEHEAKHKYDNIVNIFANLAKPNTSSRLLGEGVLLLELNKGLSDVRDALQALRKFSYSYAILTEDVNLIQVEPLSNSSL